MTDGARLVALSAELATLTAAVARAIEAGDLAEAERLVDARGRLLHGAPTAAAAALSAEARGRIAVAARAVRDAERQCRDGLARISAACGEALTAIGTGATALRAYGAHEGLAPGFVDRRD